jgi:hypothetical protein
MEENKTDEIIELIRKKESRTRSRNVVVFSIILLLGSGFTFFAIFHVFQSKKEARHFENGRDSVARVNQIYQKDLSKTDSIKWLVHIYQNKKELSDEKLSRLFSDSVERFYTMTNISNKEVLKQSKWFWNKFPDEHFRFDSGFSIKNIDSAIVSVFLTGNYCKTKTDCRDEIEEIRINKDYKICFVRAYFNDK